MKFTVEMTWEKGRYDASPRRPYIDRGSEKIVAEVEGKSTTIEFEVKAGWGEGSVEGLNRLAEFATVLVTADNATAIWKLVSPAFDVNRVPYRGHAMLLACLTTAMGYSFEQLFTIIYNQEGWGYMGGVGCGQLIHKLQFHKVMGPLPELTGVIKTLATLRFSSMLGEVKDMIQSKKYLRDAIKPEDIFVTLNAHPICQDTVLYHGAVGYVVRGAGSEACTCQHCAKKLGLVIAEGKRKTGTPDFVIVGDYKVCVNADQEWHRRVYRLSVYRVDREALSAEELAAFYPNGKNFVSRHVKARALASAKFMVEEFIKKTATAACAR